MVAIATLIDRREWAVAKYWTVGEMDTALKLLTVEQGQLEMNL